MSSKWTDEIFKQTNLLDVYKLSRRALPRSKQNKYISVLASIILVVTFGATIAGAPETYKASDALEFMKWASGQSFMLALGILGFLIAGFAIFASITKVDIFIELAKTPYKRCKEINYLQYVFFNFLNVFTIYIGLLALSLAVQFAVADSSSFLRLFPRVILSCQKVAVSIGRVFSFLICQ